MEQEKINENENDNEISKYIDEIKKLKETTVAQEDYKKLQNENKQLLKSLVKGETIEEKKADEKEIKENLNNLRKDLFDNENLNNLDFCKKALELRQTIIDSGGVDPFLPVGSQIVITDSDIEAANRVADIMKECVEYADGDSQLFTNELMRRTVDISIKKKKK